MGNKKSKQKDPPPSVLRIKSMSVDEKHDENDCDGAPHYNCDACKRIVQILKYYHKWNQYHSAKSSLSSSSKDNENNTTTSNDEDDKLYNVGMFEYIDSSYTLIKLNDDYIHIVEHHDNELERLKDYTLQQIGIEQCNIASCKMMERNNRSRSRISLDNQYRKSLYNGYETSDEISTQQILDKIHSYILHSFDSLKLTENEIDEIEEIQEKSLTKSEVPKDSAIQPEISESSDEKDDDQDAPLKDSTLQKYKVIVDKKKFIMRDIATIRQKSHKFASTLDENTNVINNDDIKDDQDSKNYEDEEVEENEEEDSLNPVSKKKLDTYSFGVRFYYWQYYKDLDEFDAINGGNYADYYIKPRHKVKFFFLFCLSMLCLIGLKNFFFFLFLWIGSEGRSDKESRE